MSYLDGKPVDHHILDEIEVYKKRLRAKLDNDNNESDNKQLLANAIDKYDKDHFSPYGIRHFETQEFTTPYHRNYLKERPPFPLLDIL